MNDIIWITYKGRRIPIKLGMKGKFKKKNDKMIEDNKKLKPYTKEPIETEGTYIYDKDSFNEEWGKVNQEEPNRLMTAKIIAKRLNPSLENASNELLEREAKKILQYNEGEALEKGEIPFKNSKGELERSTESLIKWRDSLKNKNNMSNYLQEQGYSKKDSDFVVDTISNMGKNNNNKYAINYMEDQFKAFDRGDISVSELERAKKDSGLSKQDIEKARNYVNDRVLESYSRTTENKTGNTTSQPVPKNIDDRTKWYPNSKGYRYENEDKSYYKIYNSFNDDGTKMKWTKANYDSKGNLVNKEEYENLKEAVKGTPRKLKNKRDYEEYFRDLGYSREQSIKWGNQEYNKTINSIEYKSLSDYEQYFINKGYSKATALRIAQYLINNRKSK